MKTKLESEVVETQVVTMIKLLALVGGGGLYLMDYITSPENTQKDSVWKRGFLFPT